MKNSVIFVFVFLFFNFFFCLFSHNGMKHGIENILENQHVYHCHKFNDWDVKFLKHYYFCVIEDFHHMVICTAEMLFYKMVLRGKYTCKNVKCKRNMRLKSIANNFLFFCVFTTVSFAFNI